MSKVSECYTEMAQHLHGAVFKYALLNLDKYLPPLKFCRIWLYTIYESAKRFGIVYRREEE